MLKNSIRRVTNHLAKAKYNLATCKVVQGAGERPAILAHPVLAKAWHKVYSLRV